MSIRPTGRVRLSLVAVLGALAIGAPGGCGVNITAPVLHPGEPTVAVYIADYGRHSSLLLPRVGDGHAGEDGERRGGVMAEYAFGQWDWYVLGKQESWRGPLILLFPSRATLGTRDLPPPRDAPDLAARLGLAAAYEMRVRESDVRALLGRLDARFAAEMEGLIYNEAFDLHFVPDPDSYWLPYNCNTAVAAWLRELDCRVGGLAIVSNFTVSPDGGPDFRSMIDGGFDDAAPPARPPAQAPAEDRDPGNSFPPLP